MTMREDVGGIDAILGFHIRLAHGAVYRHFTDSFAHLDLTQKQVSALWLVEEHPGIVQAEIARRLQMDRATTMGIVGRLERRGYLARAAEAGDRRRRALTLTAAGTAALAGARAAIAEHEAWLKGRFSAAEVAALIGLLERIHG